MADVMDIYEDYASWKKENHNLIYTLVQKRSKTIARFACVLAVVDFLYARHCDGRKISEDEEVIFSTGFDYIYDQFMMISNVLESDFDNSIDEMEKCAQTINLLLYIMDFESEVKSVDDPKVKKEMKLLTDLEDKVNTYLEKRENAPDEYFAVLNDITNKIFAANDIEVTTVDQIFYEIAVEYNIYQDDDFDIYNEVLNRQIAKTRKTNNFIA